MEWCIVAKVSTSTIHLVMWQLLGLHAQEPARNKRRSSKYRGATADDFMLFPLRDCGKRQALLALSGATRAAVNCRPVSHNSRVILAYDGGSATTFVK